MLRDASIREDIAEVEFAAFLQDSPDLSDNLLLIAREVDDAVGDHYID